ncbi:tRNA (adenosine(37)-N6)-threonylcarbamoyltransferase complex ATPase subunit type 1 TsaE [Loktanella sp. IMCC34160]|uniref:tRNA (adenosine(37)-N6)-threonylcarbamoyltransferase complex ATPase subunit type 1 TsaE n=1 Tax=Loktanella sp. IMCC34160 TaxID=2510646 RepID=UPI00101E1694|nr:tRNA (adenosine(37)-N6)-threonylcarbamoyltransferase complex ATPase subunit type 1 TsaE [Loktanella sp. IMCC34160]RYG91307.1 tRNA (adenosine(37)-N6)-threonylcarbamoyltransferase complex ATPase subunit type 1 TsaE [Loktanella sp. IMCC34160]
MQFQTGPYPLATEAETEALARGFADILHAGDTLLLEGEIGAGKSAFSRALIRARLGRDEDVPSPTFTLVQTYDAGDVDIWHCDLYRLSSPEEALELGLDEAFTSAICLIEWPDRLDDLAPETALTLRFEALDNGHRVTFRGPQDWAGRLDKILVRA